MEGFVQIAEQFRERWNFPNCIGSVDGKHIRVKCPRNSGSLYYNYKKFFSVVLQAVVGADYRFLFVDMGGFGQQADGGTFMASAFGQAFRDKTLPIPPDTPLPRTERRMPFVFLGDDAYPLSYNLMKPYPAGCPANTKEYYFNARLLRARKTVECAFGIINARFRILWKPMECGPEHVDDIVLAICILHNTIIDKEGIDDNTVEAAERLSELSRRHEEERRNRYNRGAELPQRIREEFANYFWYDDHLVLKDLIKPATVARWSVEN
jgi:hypothetical protein